ncbi:MULTISPECIES: hypothetical protein [Exiguobacterium]|uniref:hypothetical protein n=1 Tax=Exiguobacterium TaxID=33986 RepID=UPI001AE9B72C|nr:MULTISPECIES: hypothetical protein [Exiguobacterium]MCT4779848.1 hypothetical protein [Exiguobacterium soli]
MKRTHLLRGKTLYKAERRKDGTLERVWQYGDFIAYEYEELRKVGWQEWRGYHSKQASNSK